MLYNLACRIPAFKVSFLKGDLMILPTSFFSPSSRRAVIFALGFGLVSSAPVLAQSPDEPVDEALANGREFVVFSARNNEPGFIRRLFRTDGTPRGTIVLSTDLTQPEHIAPLGDGRAMLSAIGGNEYTPVVTNGQRRGTRAILPASQEGMGSPSRGFVPLNDTQVIFQGYSYETGFEPWVTNMRARGTRMIADVYPGTDPYFGRGNSSGPIQFTPLGDGRAVFVADEAQYGSELWVSGGRARGTRLVLDGVPGPTDNTILDLTAIGNGRAIYSGLNERFLSVVHITDGTPRGTFELQPATGRILRPRGFYPLADGRVMFLAGFDSSVRGMWVTDGTPAGTQPLLIDGQPISMENVTAMGDGTYLFSASHQGASWFWRTDGTEDGTVPIAEIRAGRNVTAPYGGRVLEIAPTGDGGAMAFVVYQNYPGQPSTYQLWVTDGATANGTSAAFTFPTTADARPMMLTPVGNGRMVFVATTTAAGRELWVSNGTRRGTRLLADLYPGAFGSDPQGLVSLIPQ